MSRVITGEDVEDFVVSLYELLDSWSIKVWAKVPNPELGGRTPVDVLNEPGGLAVIADLMRKITNG